MPAEPPRLLVLLQNRYDRGGLADCDAPGVWRGEFLASRTGRRLRAVIAGLDGWRIHYANSATGLHTGPDSRPPADPRQVRRALARVRPDLVLACGKVAEAAALAAWAGPLVAIPHPACRVVTDELLRACSIRLAIWGARRVEMPDLFWPHSKIGLGNPRFALRQRRGSFTIEDLT